MPAASKKSSASDVSENLVPDLNADALQSLTEKIEGNLKNRSRGVRPKIKTPSFNAKVKVSEHGSKSSISNSDVTPASNGSAATGKQKSTLAPRIKQGKKRLRDGRIKEGGNGKEEKNVNSIKLGISNRKSGSDDNSKIDEEMKALGGTKEDFDLIADIISESEMEGDDARPGKNPQSGLEKEILQLVRQLGVDRVAKKELTADSGSNEADEVGELTEDWGPDMVSSKKETPGVIPALPTSTSVRTGHKSLVSK